MVFNSKKGFMGEIITVVIVLAIFGVISLLTFNFFTDINNDIQASSDMNTEAKASVNDLHSRFASTFDGAFIVIFTLLWILGIVAAYMSDNNPLFLILIVVALIFLLIIAGFMSNVWDDISSDEDINYTESFPFTNFILDNFLITAGAIIGSIVTTMYMKARG